MYVGVCDFPGRYAFPPLGYAGIERWLWATAVGARRAGATVRLLGYQWRPELAARWPIDRVRLEDPAAGRDLDCDLVTFQHGADKGQPTGTFDGMRSRLFCYSPEMMARYRDHRPRQDLAVNLGLGEDEPPARDGRDLVWVGRIEPEKAPH